VTTGLHVQARAFAAAFCLAAAATVPGAAQAVAGGSVVRMSGGAAVPVPGVRVVLHRIGRDQQGPVDSAATDARGRFRLRFETDTSVVHLASARYDGVEYFSTPVHLNAGRPDTALRIVVADTSSTAPVSLEARHLVVSPAGQDGSRSVVDLIVLRNGGERTRVAPDTVHPTWSGALPAGSDGLEVGEGEFSASAVTRQDDRLLFFAPFPPGERQIVAQYLIAAERRRVELTFDQPAGLLNVLVAEPEVEVSGPGIAFADVQTIEGRSYRRFTGPAPAGTTLRIVFPRPPLALRWLLPGLVAVVAGALVLAGAWSARAASAGGARGGDPAATADGLLSRLAALDAEHEGREAAIAPEEWRRYREERARLKAELAAALTASSQ
jgi:hypothetical protein